MKFKLLNCFLFSAISLFPIVSFTSCAKNDDVNVLYNKLINLENVTKVETIKNASNFRAKFIVWFKQYLDYDNPSAGTFEQRVELGFRSFDAVNVFVVNGYTLENSNITSPRIFPIIDRYSANYISVEYRYFNYSSPATGAISKEWDGPYWKYFNSKSACIDFHNILTQFKTILNGKWVMEGGSKGGQSTNIMAYYYPTDMNAYVAFVPPLPFKNVNESAAQSTYRDSNDLCRWIYGNIGADYLPEEELNLRKKAVSTIQYYVLQNKEQMLQKLQNEMKTQKIFLTELGAKNNMYLIYQSVFNFNHGCWQNNAWDDIKGWYHEIVDKSSTAFDDVYDAVVSGAAEENALFPYEIQAWKEMGKCSSANIDLVSEYIANNIGDAAVTKEVVKDIINIDNDDKNYFGVKMNITDPIRTGYEFDDTLYTNLDTFFKTKSEANVIEIHGGLDPWRAYYKQVEDWKESGQLAQNIHVYICRDQSHAGATINALPASDKQEVWSLLDNWVK